MELSERYESAMFSLGAVMPRVSDCSYLEAEEKPSL
jgi:hypothetical protein